MSDNKILKLKNPNTNEEKTNEEKTNEENTNEENTNEENTKGKLRRTGYVENGNQKFLILDAPTDNTIDSYIEVLNKKKVSIVVRACEATYNPQPIEKAGIRFKELPFTDGEPPPKSVLDAWLLLLSEEFGRRRNSTVGVHCVAGLGRAPILVAIALVESGKDPFEAIDMIRKARKGALNARQLAWIEKYKRRRKHCGPVCTIC